MAETKAKTKALKIRSTRADGHRRAGRRWPSTDTVVPADELDKTQRAALEADPNIVLVETEVAAPKEGD